MTVVSSSNPPPSLSRRDRMLLICAVSLFLTAAAIFGSLYWLAHPARTKKVRIPPHWVNPASEAELAATLQKAKWMRERFAVWARAHKEELQALRRAAPDDEAAMLRVYNALPTYPTEAENGFDGRAMMAAAMKDNIMFCWNIDSHLIPPSAKDRDDPLVQKHLASGHAFLVKMMRHNYATQHDVALGFSMTHGPICYTLWASGRLTETHLSLGGRVPKMLDAREIEVLPPYTFIH